MASRILVTGSSGHLGALLVAELLRSRSDVRVWGIDLGPPRLHTAYDRFEFLQRDVCDGITELVQRHEIQLIAHMAYPLAHARSARDWRRMAEVATDQVLRAAEAPSVIKVAMVSSTTVYGTHARRIVANEDQPPSPNPDYAYAVGKVKMESLTQAWRQNRSHCAALILRPCIVIGPRTDNYMTRSIFQQTPFVDGCDPRLQFLHEDDFAAAVAALLFSTAEGVFNITPDDLGVARSAVHRLFGMPVNAKPYDVVKADLQARWESGDPDAAEPSIVDLIAYEWCASNVRLKQLGMWRPAYTSAEALLSFSKALRAKHRRKAVS